MKKKTSNTFKIILTCIFCAIYIIGYSQVRFNKLLDDDDSSIMCSIIAEDNGQYTLCIGTVVDNNRCFEIVRCDIGGNVIWRKPYWKSGVRWYEGYEHALKKTNDGNYIFTGSYFSDVFTEHSIPFLMKLDSNGDSLWTKFYDFDNATINGFNVIQTDDNGYAISGIIYYYTNGSHTDTEAGDALIIKTDSLGNMQWYNSVGGSGLDSGEKIVQTSDGGYMIGGTSNSYGSQDMYLVKTDSLGVYQWHRTYGNPSLDDGSIKDLIKTTDGMYIICGARTMYYDIGTGFRTHKARLIKINESGDSIWDKLYSTYIDTDIPNDTTYAWLYSIKELSNGNIVGTGYFQEYYTIQSFTWAEARGMMWKFSSNGDSLWSRKYDPGLGTEQYTGLLSVIDRTPDNGFILGGRVEYNDQDPYQKIWLIKVDSLGHDYPTYIDEVLLTEEIAVYPNPAADFLNIRFSEQRNLSDVSVEIYDINGIQYFIEVENNVSHLHLDVSGLSDGMYLVRVTQKGKLISSAKFMKH